jgi:HPt (histidine-containing phosphotransfer) domain-containing protein
MDDFVTKPVTRAKLEALIDANLSDVQPPAEGPASSGPADIDSEQQAALIEELGAEQFDELLAHFRLDAIQTLAEATAEGASDTAIRALHSLKGMAHTLGLRTIGDLAARAEQTARAGQVPELAELHRSVAALSPDETRPGLLRAS